MARQDKDRSERVSRLQALVEDDKLSLPQFDQPAFDTMLARLDSQKRRRARWKSLGWLVLALLALALLWLFYAKLL